MDMLDELTGPWDFSRPTSGGRVHATAVAHMDGEELRVDVPHYDRRSSLVVRLGSLREGSFVITGPSEQQPVAGRVTVELQAGSRVLELFPDAFPSAMVWTLQRLTEF